MRATEMLIRFIWRRVICGWIRFRWRRNCCRKFGQIRIGVFRMNGEIRDRVSSDLVRRLGGIEELFEGKIPSVLGRNVPAGTRVFISNSTPIRDAEYFFG